MRTFELAASKHARNIPTQWLPSGGMLVSDYLYRAAEHPGIIFKQPDGTYVDCMGREVTRFGFHNLRKAVSEYLTEGKKADVRTIQDTL